MESDETFFWRSEKAKKFTSLKSRKREGKSDRPVISNDQVAVIVIQGRKSTQEFIVATLG